MREQFMRKQLKLSNIQQCHCCSVDLNMHTLFGILLILYLLKLSASQGF